MRWSKFNYIFFSKKYGYFVYNSTTNAFFELNEELYDILKKIKQNADNIILLKDDIKKVLIKAKVLVGEKYDENYILKQKVLTYSSAFSSESLHLVIAPTLGCNFACPYCYEHNLEQNIMTTEVENNLLKFIKNYNKNSGVDIAWYGGEPLIAFKRIKSILKKLKKQNIILDGHSLVTNGYLINGEVIDYFKNNKLDNIQITIDGTKEKHDSIRKLKSGRPTFDIILRNLDNFTSAIPETHVTLRVNISKENQNDFPILYKYLNNRYNGKNFSVSPALVTDHGGCKVDCLGNKDKLDFLKELYFKHHLKEVEFYPSITEAYVCTAQQLHSFVVDPNGYLYKCWVDIGKKERIIENLDNTIVTNPDLVSRYLMNTDKFSDPKCLDCFLFPVCDGGCGLFRLDHQLFGIEYDVCPINRENIVDLLESFYAQHLINHKENA